VVLVSSGAIGCGMKTMGFKKRPQELKTLQACAAIGQGKLMKAYEDLFSEFGYHTGQVLLTRNGFQDRARCLNVRHTIQELVRLRAVPIINENDTVSTEEIRFGDNDTLSVCVAELIEADLLILLSDVDGVYAGGRAGDVISRVDQLSEVDELFQHVFNREKKVVTAGGMQTKLEVAKRAMRSGISKKIGTLFVTPKTERRGFKKNWLTDLTQAHGNIQVDDGAYKALLQGGKSLLPSGVRELDGHFKAGDSVRVSTEEGKTFARGIVNYSKEELSRIKGKRTSDIAAILGYKHHDEVIHRDNLVILE
jgi:glutamate 5-kinase